MMPDRNAADPTWAAFLAAGRTLANERRDFSDWHRGRPRYCFWALELAGQDVERAMAAAQGHLGAWLLTDYWRQPHVTLALCGFPTAEPWAEGAFGPAAWARWGEALAEDAPEPFAIQVGRLRSFASAPFLAVDDPQGGVGRLRQILAAERAGHPHGCYVPHVTVGLYAEAWPVREVSARIAAFDHGVALSCRVGAVSLLSYEAAVIGGPLRREASFDLATRRLEGAPPWPSR